MEQRRATLGTDFARAFADKDADRIRELVHAEVEFRALTPSRTSFADRERVGYRLAVHNPDGRHLVEQQAYIEERDGKIGWMRVVCSGFRPI